MGGGRIICGGRVGGHYRGGGGLPALLQDILSWDQEKEAGEDSGVLTYH